MGEKGAKPGGTSPICLLLAALVFTFERTAAGSSIRPGGSANGPSSEVRIPQKGENGKQKRDGIVRACSDGATERRRESGKRVREANWGGILVVWGHGERYIAGNGPVDAFVASSSRMEVSPKAIVDSGPRETCFDPFSGSIAVLYTIKWGHGIYAIGNR